MLLLFRQTIWLPQISSIVQGELHLSHDVYCVDIPSACAGFVVGLINSFMILDHMEDKKVVSVPAKYLTKKQKKMKLNLKHPLLVEILPI